jgi:hypothetical protein
MIGNYFLKQLKYQNANMKIKILSFSYEIHDLRDNRIFFHKIAQQYPGALWISYLKKSCPFDLEFQTVDRTLKLVMAGKVDPSTVAVFQHNIDKEATKLIRLGAFPFLLYMHESPLYCGKFYDSINVNVKKFHHVKIFGANLFKIDNLSQAYFPCFDQSQLKKRKKEIYWKDRRFASMVVGNKYVLTRPLTSFKKYRDWGWWFLKRIRQYIKGPRLPKKINICEAQLQDARLDILVVMLKRAMLDLYGNGWDKLVRIPPSIASNLSFFLQKKEISPIEDKNEVISKYRFNICFENVAYPGYITEKIFDAFLAKTIPVYYGAPDITEFIPSNSFIDASKFEKFDDLIEYLINIDPACAIKIIENGQIFLQSSEGRKFSYEVIANEIIGILKKFIGF